MMIGHWMRQHAAAALIYPSARCDVAAVFHEGALNHSQGWNLVDFRDAPVFGVTGAQLHLHTLVTSPWAWVNLPAGVRLQLAPEASPLAGSFAIEHVVNYWAQDYTDQVRALELARAVHGNEKDE